MAKALDLRGMRFGRLVARRPTYHRDRRGSVYWICDCDCGNEGEFTEAALVHGYCRSCGCLRREMCQKLSEKLTMTDGTCIEMLESRKHRRDNKSGVQGVFQMKNGKFRAYIGFKGKRYYLGTYEEYEDAIRARKKAEEEVYSTFLRRYKEWKRRADEDPRWGETHPLKFEIEKHGNRLRVKKERRAEE